MHDVEFVNGILADIKEEPTKYETFERIDGLLNVISEVKNGMENCTYFTYVHVQIFTCGALLFVLMCTL